MKKLTKIITIIIILIVGILMFISFFGINKKNEEGQNVNLLPNYKMGMEFGSKRVISAEVNSETIKTITDSEGNVIEEEEGVEYTEENGYTIEETPINKYSDKNTENYQNEKKIIEKRLNGYGVKQYLVNLDKKTGTIEIEIPEDSDADNIQNMIENSGKLILYDGETFETVLDSSYYLKEAEVMYSQGNLETAVFLQIEFNDEGTKLLRELSEIYVETTEEQTNEAGEVETVTNSKKVWVILNDEFLGTAVLPDIIYNDKIMFTFGVSSDTEELNTAMKEAQEAAMLLNSGESNLIYDYSNETVENSIEYRDIAIYFIAIGMVFVIAYIYLVIKFRAKGFISVYFQIGFIAVLLLVLRLTNVYITFESIAGIIIAIVLDYIFTYIMLQKISKHADKMYNKTNFEFLLNTLPIYAISLIFTFASKININSFGMSLFWGILIIYLYNFIFSKYVFENLSMEGKNENI